MTDDLMANLRASLEGARDHNRWAPNCTRFRRATGSATQYLVDYNRFEQCPACPTNPEGDGDE